VNNYLDISKHNTKSYLEQRGNSIFIDFQ